MPNTEEPTGGIELGNLRQEKVALQISELLRNKKNISKTTLGQILTKAGYSKTTALAPSNVTKSPSFQRLLDRYLPERSLLKRHKNLLDAKYIDKYIFPNSTTDEEMRDVVESIPGCHLIKIQRNSQWARAYYSAPDNKTQREVLELAYKLRKKLGGHDDGDGESGMSGEIREVVFRIKRILPSAGT